MSQSAPTQTFKYFDLMEYDPAIISTLPITIKILLENLLRHEDGQRVSQKHIDAVLDWRSRESQGKEIPFFPSRVLLQDLSGIPLLVDLAAMRDVIAEMGGDPLKINPLKPMELVVDHSIMVDYFGTPEAHEQNKDRDYERNGERYQFFKWAQKSLQNVRIVPPHTGIVHQINIEYLSRSVFVSKTDENEFLMYPDTVVGTDSHTTMVNGLGILGWGVGGIEAEAVALGQPIPLTIPEVIGVRLQGSLRPSITATDLVLTLTHILRKYGVVNKFVEFFGEGLAHLSVADRVTISNMSPEFGSTAALFPFDEKTLQYFKLTGRDPIQCEMIETYHRNQGLISDDTIEPIFTDVIVVNLSEMEPCIAGPGRPQDRISLKESASILQKAFPKRKEQSPVDSIRDGNIVLAAITSCTNTSNPAVLITAGLLAKKAVDLGLKISSSIKTSLAPGSQTVKTYLSQSNLLKPLEDLGFFIVGYGCTTCIGNSGPLEERVEKALIEGDYNVCAVLSGNRNFEGRIHPLIRSSYLASPPLVVAYALAGHMLIDFERDPIGISPLTHQEIFLKDLWPSESDIQAALHLTINPDLYKKAYEKIFEGDERWKAISSPESAQYAWDKMSTYLKRPPYLERITDSGTLSDINKGRILAVFEDSLTTDHISPAGTIGVGSPAGQYLQLKGVASKDFNSYGSRRGHDAVMIRGTFSNPRLKNKIVDPKEGGITIYWPTKEILTIFEASQKYSENKTDLLILAGKEYGTGSSRDWAAKGTKLLGVKAVIAESYERIHRSNLIGMGIVPLEFLPGESLKTYELTGEEEYSIKWDLSVRGVQKVSVISQDGTERDFFVRLKIETPEELVYLTNEGILPYVLRTMRST